MGRNAGLNLYHVTSGQRHGSLLVCLEIMAAVSPWIPITPWWWTARRLSSLILDGLLSSGGLRWRIPNGRHAWSLPKWMSFGRAQLCFFWPFGFRESVRSSAAYCRHGTCLSSTVKLDAKNGMRRTSNGGLFTWWWRDSSLVICDLEQRHWQVGAISQEEFSV